ncbi:putative family 20 transposase [Alteromonas sp. KUL17]|uniref:IS110 family transposase n=1 Tax=Alteromonas sp. KUL17 TaxID=2480796 RepID=UPI001037354E|nr:IS110 family transposase [Alteromonas sp. KUL17]TAP31157.1 IS110 family transposase [Alteromonas sp. KUL17]GEA01285.1 putative family 20 transposase [Alteromonas sp. KUL17]
MNIKVLGIDLAKYSFSIHGVNEHDKPVFRKTVKRHKLLETLSHISPCTIGIEACSGAHHWARKMSSLGHTVKIMAPKFVVPYRHNEKNDANDARAICEAVTRPNTRFVSHKNQEQQAVLCIHRIRQGLIKDRTARLNRIRGLLEEFGFATPKGRYPGQKVIQTILEDAENDLPNLARELIDETWQSVLELNKDILHYDRKLYRLANQSNQAKRIMTIPGIGELSATAIVASVNDAKQFDNARQFSAWLGLVPKQYTTGGHIRLGRITKRGDKYLRTLLIHGARSVIAACKHKTDKTSLWIKDLIERRGFGRACVALASKNARLVWALLTSKQEYRINF